MVEIVRQERFLGAFAILVSFLVANEDIERFFLVCNFKYSLLNSVNCQSFFFIKLLLLGASLRDCRFVVFIRQNGCILHSVYCGNARFCACVLDVFDSVLTKHERPIRFGVGGVFVQKLLVKRLRLIKFVVSAQVICSIEKNSSLFAFKLRNRLLRAAINTPSDRFHPLNNFKFATAIFTFKIKNVHNVRLLCLLRSYIIIYITL